MKSSFSFPRGIFLIFIFFSINKIFGACPNYSIAVGNSNSTHTVCPWGFPTALSAQLKQGNTPLNGAIYTWQPGNITQQNPVVNPLVTTTYTVYATLSGCTYSNVTTVTVVPVTAPTISYTPAPYSSTTAAANPAVFAVTQTGVSGGVYSIAPSNASVTINASSGLISAWGNSYGTYTVTYHISPFSEGGGFCEDYFATTVIQLQTSNCPITIPVSSFTLCPDDKVVFTSTVNFPVTGNGVSLDGSVSSSDGTRGNTSLSWAPSAAGNTSTLSCTTCSSPTLTCGNTSTIYTLTAYYNGQVCGTATVNVTVKEFCEKDEILGCCFSNYGAAVWLNDNSTYLNVYCNLLNELGYTAASTPTLQKGEFQNVNGSVRVLLDWIHNAKNNLYTTTQGTTSVFGADQKIKGTSNTHFNELWLNGNGTKSIWIDEYAHASLDLTSNILSEQNFVFFMKNPAANVIRTTGYVSNGTKGYFSWVLNTTATQPVQNYLYPTGAKANANYPFRYRPLVIANNSSTQSDEISANFMNIPPSLLTDAVFANSNSTLANIITNQAPNVLQLNNAFYHKIKNTSTPTIVSNLNVKSFYFAADGQFQSIAEWEKDPNQTLDWWGSTPGSGSSNSPSSDPGTPGMIYAMANGTLNFNNIPFTLARGGFYLNTNSFGNVGGAGTTFSITAVPPGGSLPTPTGGGLNNPYGTGSNSGNAGGGGNTVFTPSPVSGEYIMTISPANPCATGGKIRFVIDQNGNISPTSVKYGITPNVYLGELSEAVYTIDNVNSGITFSAVPKDLLKNCVNSITITTTNNDHVFTSGENIIVTLPSVGNPSNTITYGQFKIFNKANSQVFASGLLSAGSTNLSPTLPVDIYRFELSVNASTSPPTTEIVRGQIIVK